MLKFCPFYHSVKFSPTPILQHLASNLDLSFEICENFFPYQCCKYLNYCFHGGMTFAKVTNAWYFMLSLLASPKFITQFFVISTSVERKVTSSLPNLYSHQSYFDSNLGAELWHLASNILSFQKINSFAGYPSFVINGSNLNFQQFMVKYLLSISIRNLLPV